MSHTLCCAIFIIIVFINIFYFLKIYRHYKRKAKNLNIIIPLCGHCENIEYIIRSIIFRSILSLKIHNIKIICFNVNSDEETLHICHLLSKKHSNVFVYNKSNNVI